MRIALVSTHRSDRAHYAPLRRLLEADARFELVSEFSSAPIDAAVVLGDRVEMLQAAIGLVDARIPLLHIHGGEHTYGSLDERWRWAMTELADVHCVATKEAADEIFWGTRQMNAANDDPVNVHITGAPGLDDIHDRKPFPNAPKIVVLYNPAIDEETTVRESRAIAEAVHGEYVIWVAPNGDRFSDRVYIDGVLRETMAHDEFRDLLAAAHVIVGNSSAGIIEAPSLGTWTVNVGERQAGRPRAGSVGDVPGDAAEIRQSIAYFLDQGIPIAANPYGDGHASERIRDVLLSMK